MNKYLAIIAIVCAGCSGDSKESQYIVNTINEAIPETKVLFSENFDSQPDWTSGMYTKNKTMILSNSDVLPNGWYSAYQDPVWSDSVGHQGGRENIEILAKNREQAKNGSGKSLVVWRDSTTAPYGNWNSDGQLTKYFPQGHSELFVRFSVKFSPDWTPVGKTGLTKLFRVGHWNGVQPIYKFFNNGNSGPIMIWDYEYNDVGARLALTLRGYPIDKNYEMKAPPIINWPRQQGTINFDNNIRDLNGDGIVDNNIDKLLNLKTGKPIGANVVEHDELWGTNWHTIETYVKMNSAPGKYDGVLQMWIDGQLVVKNITVPWAGIDAVEMPLWNFITFGGNSHFHAYPDELKRQEWVAFDDITVYEKNMK